MSATASRPRVWRGKRAGCKQRARCGAGCELRLVDGTRFLLPDIGGPIPIGASTLYALPAHYLHSVGNFSFYDPVSRILFSGDSGSSLIPMGVAYEPAVDFIGHTEKMRGFHQRYMGLTRVAKLWVKMVRELNPSMIVPQHGLPMDGRTIPQFLDWLQDLPCGIDLMGEEVFSLPSELGGKPIPSGVAAF